MTRVLVIGAAGQVGRQLIDELTRRPGPLDVVAASRTHADPANRVDLGLPATVDRLVDAVRPDHVFLVAAATNVGWCEAHPAESWTINVLGVEAVARAAHRAGATLTFISTDYVFDGSCGPYGEGDHTNPINVYGAHKLAAEAVVVGEDPGNLVVRTCQVFGDDQRRANFVLRVVDALGEGETVEAAGDLFGTPTFAPDLARALAELTLARAGGVWHFAGDVFLSRYELARRVAAAFGCDGSSIVGVAADQMHDPVNRPRRAGLRNDRLAAERYAWTTPLEDALAALAVRDRLP